MRLNLYGGSRIVRMSRDLPFGYYTRWQVMPPELPKHTRHAWRDTARNGAPPTKLEHTTYVVCLVCCLFTFAILCFATLEKLIGMALTTLGV